MPEYFRLSQLKEDLLDGEYNEEREIVIQARLHQIRKQGSMIFMLLREKFILIQVVCFKKMIPETFINLSTTPKESIIRIKGILRKTEMLIKTTNNCFEIHASEVTVISPASETPIHVEDLNQFGEDRKGKPEVALHTRLNHRVLDLRSYPSQAIFRVRSKMEMIIREFFNKWDFTEIHTPKLISIPSESGSEVFPVQYFKKPAFLAQSPQLYKQMLINADFNRVFEIGPVYRAEPSISHRHLCEFTGLDFEMELHPIELPTYQTLPPTDQTASQSNQTNSNNQQLHHQIFYVINNLFTYLQTRLLVECPREIACLAQYYPGSLPIIPYKIPVIQFHEAVELLNTKYNANQHPSEDLSHVNEKLLGDIVKENLGSDIFFLESYPTNLRPFYTMTKEDDPSVTCSYDLILRGQEIASGAQRVHDYSTLLANMVSHGLTPDLYQDYLNSFKYGSPPHGGIGIGLERLLALFLNIPDVHLTSLFPRDPNRLNP